jgi:hypothetical protein
MINLSKYLTCLVKNVQISAIHLAKSITGRILGNKSVNGEQQPKLGNRKIDEESQKEIQAR